ncbi:MAG TPA: ankyrin repeat domain-containing protein [Sedimentisphaerales bacterium]|nr:ankyrin repeat domain-containing protein [Sedimentisphaerales bacterium]
MNQKENEKWLDELISRTVNSDGLEFDVEKWKEKHSEEYQILKSRTREGQGLPANILGLIAKHRVTRLAAAAVIIAAAIIGLHYLPDPVGFTAPAFGEVIQNMQRMKWIYFFKEDLQEGTIREQVWASPELQILAGTGIKGWVAFVDCKAKREYNYSPQQGAIEVSYPQEDAGGMYGVYVFSRLGLMDEVIRMHEEEDAYITKEKATYNGKDAIVYRFEVGLSSDVAEISNWVVDAETHLPIINEVLRVASGGQVQRSHRFAFDYPDTGPKDIYDLGVPEDVNVIDKTPSEAVEEVLRAYQESSKSTVKRYIALIKQWDQPRYIEYGDGLRKRVERYELAINGSDWMAKKEFYRKQMGDTFDSVFLWLKNTEVMSRVNIELHDGIFYYRIHAGEMRDGKGPRREREYSLRGVFAQLGWPQMRFEGEVTEDAYSREHGLICVNGAYIDRNRDYICTKWGSREVVEFGRTESGHWYAKKVEGAEGTATVYLKENPDFPRDIFSPNSLPNYAEWESNDVEAGFVIRKPRSDSNEVPAYEGFTPLHMAVFTGNMEAARRLLAGGADVNPRFNSGATPMELAAAAGRLDMVKLLFEHGAGFTNLEGHCALAAAVDGGNLEVVRFMLDNGVDVNGFYKDGETALHHAAEQAKTEFVKLLLEYGADVEIKGGRWDSHSALYSTVNGCIFADRARYKDYVATARLLLEAGADVDTKGQGLTPLSLLCLEVNLLRGKPNIELIKLLLDSGADVNFHRPGDCTPLINAVITKNLELTKTLVEGGADPFIEMHSLWPSPIAADIAALNGSREIEELLREYMEPRVSADNKAIRGVITRLLNAVRDGSSDAVREIDLDCPLHKGMWESRLKTLHDDYAGHYELFDDILSMRAQSGWAEVIMKGPEADKERYFSIMLMHYPDDSWKVVSWYSHSRSLDPKYLFQHPPSLGMRRSDLDDYRNSLFKAAGKRMN